MNIIKLQQNYYIFQLLYKEITKKIIYLIFIILLTRVLSMQHLILHANVLN